MKRKEDMTYDELTLRSIIIDCRKDLIGGIENAYLDNSEEEFFKTYGTLNLETICNTIYSEIMDGKEKFLASPMRNIAIEKKHIKFMGEKFVRELIMDRVLADYKKHGWDFPHSVVND